MNRESPLAIRRFCSRVSHSEVESRQGQVSAAPRPLAGQVVRGIFQQTIAHCYILRPMKGIVRLSALFVACCAGLLPGQQTGSPQNTQQEPCPDKKDSTGKCVNTSYGFSILIPKKPKRRVELRPLRQPIRRLCLHVRPRKNYPIGQDAE